MMWCIRASDGLDRYSILDMIMDVDRTQGITYLFTAIECTVYNQLDMC
jgi:hypothetical protein